MTRATPQINPPADCGETRCECEIDCQGLRARAGAQVQTLQTHCCDPLLCHSRMGHIHIMTNLSTKGDNTPACTKMPYRCLFRKDQRPVSPESDHNHLTHRGGYR